MEWSPRVGVTFDPGADGKTKFQFNYARYFQRVPNDLAVRQFSNEVGTTTFTFYDPYLTSEQYRTGTASPNVQGHRPRRRRRRDQAPVRRRVRPRLAAADPARPLDRDPRDLPRPGPRPRGHPGRVGGSDQEPLLRLRLQRGRRVTANELPFPGDEPGPFGAYVLSNPGENAGEGFPAPKRTYKALEVSLVKQLSNNWQFAANYRYSRLRGNYEGLFRNDNGQSDPNITSLFDFPNSHLMRGQFSSGPLNTDRPHVLNMFGTYFFDFGLEVGGALQWQSGVPRTALLAHPEYLNSGELPGQDPQYIFLQRGGGRVDGGHL